MNCLLYAVDVVLIADKYRMAELLQLCGQRSLELGFHWNPSKCVILDDSPQPLQYSLYDTITQLQASLSYLNIPFKSGSFLHTQELANNNASKALATMNQFSSIGVNTKDFN